MGLIQGTSPSVKRQQLRPLVWLLWAGVGAICVLGALWRVGVYAPLEPITDQIFFTQWIKRLRLADHFLPVVGDGGNFLSALMRDDSSLANVYLRQIYAAQQHIFTAFSVLWLYGWSFVAGFDIDGQVKISIWTASGALSALCLSCLLIYRNPDGGHARLAQAACAAVLAALAFSNGFLADFSATGPHNLGILLLFCSLAATTLWLRAGAFAAGRRYTLGVLLVQLTAFYGYYTNVFLLAPATFLAVALHPGWDWERRLKYAIIYGGAVIAIMAPALKLIALDKLGLIGVPTAASFFDVGREVIVSGDEVIGRALHRLFGWYDFQTEQVGAATLAIGVIGLAAMWLLDGMALPLILLVVHLGASTALAGFSYFQKTSGYIIPVLLLGAAYVTVRTLHDAFTQPAGARRWLIAGIAAIPVAICGALIARELGTIDAQPRSKPMYSFVQRGPQLRQVFADLDSKLRPGDIVVPARDALGQAYMAYSPHAGTGVTVFRSLDTMIDQLKAGRLGDYIARRGLKLPSKPVVALLAAPKDIDGAKAETIARLLGDGGFGLSEPVRIVHVHTWPKVGFYAPLLPLALYRLE